MRGPNLRLLDPLRDVQLTPPAGYCRVCGGELNVYELDLYDGLCEECRKEEEQID